MQAAELQEVATGPDGYRYLSHGPRAGVHQLLDAYLEEAVTPEWTGLPLKDRPSGQAMLESERRTQVELLRAALDRLTWLCQGGQEPLRHTPMQIVHDGEGWRSTHYTNRAEVTLSAYRIVFEALTARALPLTSEDLLHLLEGLVSNLELREATRSEWEARANPFLEADEVTPEPAGFDLYSLPTPGLIPLLVKSLQGHAAFPEPLRPWVERLRAVLALHPYFAGYKRTAARLGQLLDGEPMGLPEPGKPWTDALLADLGEMETTLREKWSAVLAHAPVMNQRKPSKKWLAVAEKLLAELDAAEFSARSSHWLPLVGQAATEHFTDKNADLLRGLLWYCGLIRNPEMLRLLGSTAEACFKKLPDGGLLCSRAGLACLWALGHQSSLEALAQLNRLKRQVKSPWAQEEIGKALQAAIETTGHSAEDVEELFLPAYGLTAPGLLHANVGPHAVEVRFARAGHPEWSWPSPDGKRRKAEPAAVKREHGEALKELRRQVADVSKLFSAQRDRLERLLLSDRSWSLADWRVRYLDHPLLAPLTQRLIWHFQAGDRKLLAIPHEARLTRADDRPVEDLPEETRVRLWHPLGFGAEEVQRWRLWLEEHGVTQPFKQAHREVYLLTDAELNSGTYSNRFAAHLLKQHQVAALARQRDWTYEYLGTWDSGGAGAVRVLPQWGLQAELWVGGAGGGVAASGVALYLSTDQVRFVRRPPDGGPLPHALGSHAPLPLTEVPALVFTEVMRDVDLFVGVSSVGNDPAWQDGGADHPHQEYWESYSFGDLAATAVTRREVLERLLPRLKIKDRCRLDGKFLRVQGELRGYKIHLGSGNVLMEPNDQYLCIVPERISFEREALFLPFEGDATLSLILSKAFLLAEDRQIKDPGITHQISEYR